MVAKRDTDANTRDLTSNVNATTVNDEPCYRARLTWLNLFEFAKSPEQQTRNIKCQKCGSYTILVFSFIVED